MSRAQAFVPSRQFNVKKNAGCLAEIVCEILFLKKRKQLMKRRDMLNSDPAFVHFKQKQFSLSKKRKNKNWIVSTGP
jgi:hypothetical protein